MHAGRGWSHAEWQHNEERRFLGSLCLSLLIHAVLLLAWKLPPPIWRAADHAVLTVVLRGAAPLAHSTDGTNENAAAAPLLVKQEPAPVAIPLPPKSVSTVPATSPPAIPASKVKSGSPGRMAPKAAPGRLSAEQVAPVGETVLLVIGNDGRVTQILWNTLPALTDEQLRRVEAAIRAKVYAPGQNLREVFDVRGFLNLQPTRTEGSLTLPPTTLPTD